MTGDGLSFGSAIRLPSDDFNAIYCQSLKALRFEIGWVGAALMINWVVKRVRDADKAEREVIQSSSKTTHVR
jgi:hypothetical protein